ncbi:MAG: hypothetical protein GY749_32855, partial [Desulfobacteraceae bacterium]|nr:hypothetical protein [Desulfobacteraceae bacterium]
MIITCKKCNTSFNLKDSLLKPKGSKVRCAKCSDIFIVYPPGKLDEPAKEVKPDRKPVEKAKGLKIKEEMPKQKVQGLRINKEEERQAKLSTSGEDTGTGLVGFDLSGVEDLFESDKKEVFEPDKTVVEDIPVGGPVGLQAAEPVTKNKEEVSVVSEAALNEDVSFDLSGFDEMLESEQKPAAGKGDKEPSLDEGLGDLALDEEPKEPSLDKGLGDLALDEEPGELALDEDIGLALDEEPGELALDEDIGLVLDEDPKPAIDTGKKPVSEKEEISVVSEADIEPDENISLDLTDFDEMIEQPDEKKADSEDLSLDMDEEPVSEEAGEDISLDLTDFDEMIEPEPAAEKKSKGKSPEKAEDLSLDLDMGFEEDDSDLGPKLDEEDELGLSELDGMVEDSSEESDNMELDLEMEADHDDEFKTVEFNAPNMYKALAGDKILDEAGAGIDLEESDDFDLSDIDEMLGGNEESVVKEESKSESEELSFNLDFEDDESLKKSGEEAEMEESGELDLSALDEIFEAEEEPAGGAGEGLELEPDRGSGEAEENEFELDMESDAGEDDFELDLDLGDEASGGDDLGLDLESDLGADAGEDDFELDLDLGGEASGGDDLGLDLESDSGDDLGLDLESDSGDDLGLDLESDSGDDLGL